MVVRMGHDFPTQSWYSMGESPLFSAVIWREMEHKVKGQDWNRTRVDQQSKAECATHFPFHHKIWPLCWWDDIESKNLGYVFPSWQLWLVVKVFSYSSFYRPKMATHAYGHINVMGCRAFEHFLYNNILVNVSQHGPTAISWQKAQSLSSLYICMAG